MADVLDLATTICMLNNHHVQGFGDANEVLRLPEIELLTERVGADGGVEFLGTGTYGGEFMIDLLPTASSARVLMGWLSQAQAGNHRTFNGSVQRTDGSVTHLRNGGLKSGRSGPNQGRGAAGLLTFTWYFEVVRPDYDGVAHLSVPTLPSSGIFSAN